MPASSSLMTTAIQFIGEAAGTIGPVHLQAGRYALSYVATGTGTVGVSGILPDGVTANQVAGGSAANGYSTIDIPEGQYEVIITGFTSVTGVFARCWK